MKTVTEIIREELKARLKTETLYHIANETEIQWDTLKRFSVGKGLRCDRLDTLAKYLELTVVKKSK